MFAEPAPSTYQSFRGLPERQFSASIGFSGTVQLAKAERAMLAYTSVWSRTLLKTKRIQPNDWDWRCSACCRRGDSCATCWVGVIILLVVRGMIALRPLAKFIARPPKDEPSRWVPARVQAAFGNAAATDDPFALAFPATNSWGPGGNPTGKRQAERCQWRLLPPKSLESLFFQTIGASTSGVRSARVSNNSTSARN